MKKLTLLLLFAVSLIFAQSPSSVQQSATKLDVGLFNQNTATSATTLTLTPPGSQSVYITQIDISNCQDATGIAAAAAPTYITSTNLGGALAANSLSWMMGSGLVTGTGSCVQSYSITYPTGMKSTIPGTPVTIITPTYITHQTIRVSVTYFFAP
jgi:hypothetical protein